MKRTIIPALFLICLFAKNLAAQDAVKRTPEELRELFSFCDKPELIKQFKISAETADKIAEVDLWARQQQITIDANTNERFATAGELQQEVTKKYKAFLSPDLAKAIADYKRSTSCPATELIVNHAYDTLTGPRAQQLFKTPWRKLLIEKLGETGNGRQADMLFETEVWKQKEALDIATIPETDFNRIRRTVAMYKQRESRYRAIGMNDAQIETVIQFFREHQLYPVNR
ncbi:MAG: hypothetical protein ABI581_01270 [Sediminibacterium sp.]